MHRLPLPSLNKSVNRVFFLHTFFGVPPQLSTSAFFGVPPQLSPKRGEKYDATCCALSQSLEENNLLPSAARTDFKFKATTVGSHLFPVCSSSRNNFMRYPLTCSENRVALLLFFRPQPSSTEGNLSHSNPEGIPQKTHKMDEYLCKHKPIFALWCHKQSISAGGSSAYQHLCVSALLYLF